MNKSIEELESLLLDWESGDLDPAGVERLREILRTDPEARSRFITLQMMISAMRVDSQTGLRPMTSFDASTKTEPASRGSKAPKPIGESKRFRTSGHWGAMAAAAIVFAACGWLGSLYFGDFGAGGVTPANKGGQPAGGVASNQTRGSSQEATSQGVALLTRLVDVTWEGDTAIDVGEALAPGRFAIRSGHAQIEFFCGATLVLEGPAEMELESATQARVTRGRLRAHVPPAARGFSLMVDDLKVVDLGTEFGLSVTPSGANVQVFDGEVELQPATADKRLLTAGEALFRSSAGAFQTSPFAPESFVDIADLASRAEQQGSERFERWRKHIGNIRRDPRLIALYTFDHPADWGRRLICSNEPADRELDGAIVGAREVLGRWGEKRALEFKQPADRVRIQIPGEYDSLTLACWVKIDSLDRWFNSLFLTDGYDQGEPHWQILDTGQIYFSVRPESRSPSRTQGLKGTRDFKALSPSFWQPHLSGKWIHLAVSCDLDASLITHYLNGVPLSRHAVPQEQMPGSTRLGSASIGNWALPTMPDAKFAIRNLNGSIDELIIFAAALSADEIKEIYEHGKP